LAHERLLLGQNGEMPRQWTIPLIVGGASFLFTEGRSSPDRRYASGDGRLAEWGAVL